MLNPHTLPILDLYIWQLNLGLNIFTYPKFKVRAGICLDDFQFINSFLLIENYNLFQLDGFDRKW
jgi:hypothetical protein